MSDIDMTGSESQDALLAKARKSMGNRVDPDPATDPAPDEPAKVDPPATEKPAPNSDEPNKIDDTKVDPPATDPANPAATDPAPERQTKYVPVSKYTTEKKEWAETIKEKEKIIADLKTSLENKQTDPKAGDDEIKNFADTYGINEEGISKLTAIIESKILPAEKRELLDALIVNSMDQEEAALFHKEFELSTPTLTKTFGELPAEKLAEVEKYLDEVAHTQEFADKKLGYVIFEHQDEIKKIIGGEAPKDDKPKVDPKTPDKPQRSMEPGKIGQGKPNALKAADFKDKTDFSELEAMDPDERQKLVKEMDNPTYQRLITYLGNPNKGTEVMRNGRKVLLK